MKIKFLVKLLFLACLFGLAPAAFGNEEEGGAVEEPSEDPKKKAWLEACMKDSGWYNEDGYAYCNCIIYNAGTSKPWKAMKGTMAESTCAAKELPSKEDNPRRHWVADCVQSGKSNDYCNCMADKLTGPVNLSEWIKTKDGSTANSACGG